MMTRTPPLPVLLAASLAAGILTSCTKQEDPGIKEKISLLEAELRNRDEQLAAMQEESSSQPEPESPPPASAPDLDAAKGSYLEFVENLRKKLIEAMPGAKIDRPSVFPVEGPDPTKPIVSRVGFRVRSTDGRGGEVVVPLFADPAGKWQDPPTGEIVSSFKVNLPSPPVVAAPPATPPVATPPSRPTDVMGAGKTFDIEWNDGPKQAQPRPAPAPPKQPPAPQPPPQTQSPALPKKVMPTTRDVIIDFE